MTVSEFQRAASEQGRRFEDVVEVTLMVKGWTIIERHRKVGGAEIDMVAVDPDGQEWWIECKGSWKGTQHGCRRGDTVKKAMGVAWYLSTLPERRPYMLVTSHLPNRRTLGETMLARGLEVGLFQRVEDLDSLTMGNGLDF